MRLTLAIFRSEPVLRKALGYALGIMEKHRVQLGVCVMVVAMGALLVASVASAQPRVHDSTATRAYLEATYVKARSEPSHTSAGITALETLSDRLATECRGVLAGEPKAAPGIRPTSSELEIADEVFGVFYGTVEHAEYAVRAHFAQTVGSLRWKDRALTRIIHAFATEEAEQADIPFPNLCSNLRTWADSKYQMVVSETKQYLHRLQLVSETTVKAGAPKDMDVETFIAHRLVRYEDLADRLTVRRTRTTEERSRPRLLARFQAALTKVLRVLEFST